MPSDCVVVRRETIEATLRSEATPGKKLLEPMKSFAATHGLPFKILEDSEVSTAPEVHRLSADLWCCLEGEVEFEYGGELVSPTVVGGAAGVPDPNELRGSAIRAGTTVTLHPGDWFWIPAGQPHAHRCAGTARLVIIKIPSAVPR